VIVARAESLARTSARSWLILGDTAGLGARLADALRRQGQRCTTLMSPAAGTVAGDARGAGDGKWRGGRRAG
jgi:hypothetical protein